MKNIGVLYTGGTIGMESSEHGLRPATDLSQYFFSGSLKLHWTIWNPLLDSSQIQLSHINQCLDFIEQNQHRYQGFLILHGTDTMAYTAAVVARLWHNASIPIIFTGAQKTWHETDSDAQNNIQAALSLLESDFYSVGIVFHHTLYNPLDCRKISTEQEEAFASIYQPPLGEFSKQQWHFLPNATVMQNIFSGSLKQSSTNRTTTYEVKTAPTTRLQENLKIASFYLSPTVDFQAIIHAMNTADAIILYTFGNGNMPYHAEFLQAAKYFTQNGGIIINQSQVWQGNANTRYAINHTTHNAGILNAGKRTIEDVWAELVIYFSLFQAGED